jgi:hypothetical protein
MALILNVKDCACNPSNEKYIEATQQTCKELDITLVNVMNFCKHALHHIWP